MPSIPLPLPIPVTKSKIATAQFGIPVVEWINELGGPQATAMDSRVDALEYDSGWRNAALQSGITGTCSYRRLGDWVYLSFALATTAAISGAATHLFTIGDSYGTPSSPPGITVHEVIMNTTATGVCRGYVYSGGAGNSGYCYVGAGANIAAGGYVRLSTVYPGY